MHRQPVAYLFNDIGMALLKINLFIQERFVDLSLLQQYGNRNRTQVSGKKRQMGAGG